MRVRKILGCAGAGTIIGYGLVGSIIGEYGGISASCSYLLPQNYTNQDVQAYYQCRANTVDALGVTPDNPGLINAFFNLINLPCAAAGFVLGLGYGIYSEIKYSRSVYANVATNSTVEPDLEDGRYHENSQYSEGKSVASADSKQTENSISYHSESLTSEAEEAQVLALRSRVRTPLLNFNIFRTTPNRYYEIDNSDLYERKNFNKKQPPNDTYAKDDIEMMRLKRFKR